MNSTVDDQAQRKHLCEALKKASKGQNGFGGNCATVAYILNHVLEAEGTYVVVGGDHYEFADHVFLEWKDRLWDMDGMHTREQAMETWGDEDDDNLLEDFEDPEGIAILRMADTNGIFSGGFDPGRFQEILVQALKKEGFEVHPDALEQLAGVAYATQPARRTPKP